MYDYLYTDYRPKESLFAEEGSGFSDLVMPRQPAPPRVAPRQFSLKFTPPATVYTAPAFNLKPSPRTTITVPTFSIVPAPVYTPPVPVVPTYVAPVPAPTPVPVVPLPTPVPVPAPTQSVTFMDTRCNDVKCAADKILDATQVQPGINNQTISTQPTAPVSQTTLQPVSNQVTATASQPTTTQALQTFTPAYSSGSASVSKGMQMMDPAGTSSGSSTGTSSENSALTAQTTSAMVTALQKDALVPVTQKASFPWWMLLLGGYVVLKAVSGSEEPKQEKKPDLSGVSKPKATKRQPASRARRTIVL